MNTRAYAVRLKDENEVLASSSGGAFTAISNEFLINGFAIVSAIYNYETDKNELALYTEKEERDKARGTKYIQAFPLDSFNEAYRWVKESDKGLLFVGTGCQADGFRKFSELKGIRNKVFIVGIICHGVPAPIIWEDYIALFNKKYSHLSFRDKRKGWHFPTAVLKIDGKEVDIQEYTKIFYNKCALRDSCYECPYATTNRKVDITIGDFWGVESALPDFNVGNGVSLLLTHTDKGQKFFEGIQDKVDWQECAIEKCLQPNLIKPTEKSPQREKFWADYRKGGIQKVLNKYVRGPLWKRCARKTKHLLKRILGK